jgi:hypothetical protein
VGRELDKLKARATAITDNDDLTAREKTYEIQKLYKKTKIGEKHEKPTFIRAKKVRCVASWSCSIELALFYPAPTP